MPYPFRPSPNLTKASGRAIDLIVVHTMEIDEVAGAAEACAAWFARPDAEVSAHYCVDADSVVQCVLEEDIAWHARGGNATSIGVELAGRAAQGSAGWDDPYSLATIGLAAKLTAEICTRHGVPVKRLRAEDVRARRSGITGHADVSEAFGASDHWDPGPAFPWERFIARVAAELRPIARRSVRRRRRITPAR